MRQAATRVGPIQPLTACTTSAWVVRYRDDKAPAEADGIDTLRALL